MSNNKHSGRGIYGKGYYIALILCVAAIGITGILYYRNAQEAQQVSQEPEQQATVAVDAPQEDLVVAATNPVVVHRPEAETPVEVPAPQVRSNSVPEGTAPQSVELSGSSKWSIPLPRAGLFFPRLQSALSCNSLRLFSSFPFSCDIIPRCPSLWGESSTMLL